jgi:hypothetical protein
VLHIGQQRGVQSIMDRIKKEVEQPVQGAVGEVLLPIEGMGPQAGEGRAGRACDGCGVPIAVEGKLLRMCSESTCQYWAR